MAKTRSPYPAEFREQIIELAQAGRSPADLSREFGPTIQTIVNGPAKAARDAGKPLRRDPYGQRVGRWRKWRTHMSRKYGLDDRMFGST